MKERKRNTAPAETDAKGEPILDDVSDAVKKIGVSLSFIYKQPPDTPGIYRFGRKTKINVVEFMAWARQCSIERAAARKQEQTAGDAA